MNEQLCRCYRCVLTTGIWISPSSLVVFHELPEEEKSLEQSATIVKKSELQKSKGPDKPAGQVVTRTKRIRLQSRGEFLISVCLSDQDTVIGKKCSPSTVHVHIHSCDDDDIIGSDGTRRSPSEAFSSLRSGRIDKENSGSPKPVLSFESVLGLGARGIIIPDEEVPDNLGVGWSICMWAWFWEEDLGNQIRSLFFKGTGKKNDQRRTPSAWINPGDRKLLLRVSGNSSDDLGGESTSSLPVREWTNLCFTFNNVSYIRTMQNSLSSNESAAIPEVSYELKFYMDGILDAYIGMKIAEPIFHNNGPLYIGTDPTFPGTPVLIARLKIWNVVLSPENVEQGFQDWRPIFDPFEASTTSWRAYMSLSNSFKSSDELSQDAPEKNLYKSVSLGTTLIKYMERYTKDRSGMVPRMNRQEAKIIVQNAYQKLEDCKLKNLIGVFEDLERACADGTGDKDACLILGEWLLQPGRDYCSHEVEHYLKALVSSGNNINVLDVNSHLNISKVNPIIASTNDSDFTAPRRDTATARRLIAASSVLQGGNGKSFYLWGWMMLGGIGAAGGIEEFVLGNIIYQAAAKIDPSILTENAETASLKWALQMAEARWSVHGSGEPQQIGTTKQPAHVHSLAPSSMAGLGMLHLAAALGEPEAWAALGFRYSEGYSVPEDVSSASWYLRWASDVASDQYNARGNQPFHEIHRLNADTIDVVEKGQRGDDDKLIRYQEMRAEEGHVPSMMAMGDLLYYGARGLERNQGRALQYFQRAAEKGHTPAMASAANMYLRGEGTDQDNETAIYWYEKAAAKNSTRELNGLGYMYFFGNGVTKNQSTAIKYFTNSAALHKDGDSLFNAGYCHYNGFGTNESLKEAIRYFKDAAESFGHFEAIHLLGQMYSEGTQVSRDPKKALMYLKPAVGMGSWGGIMRKGFDRYLARDHDGAVIHYLRSLNVGFPPAAANAAYLMDRRLASLNIISGSITSRSFEVKEGIVVPTIQSTNIIDADVFMAKWKSFQSLYVRHWYEFALSRGEESVLLPLGDYLLHGTGGFTHDVTTAMALYSKASAKGNAQASYNLGYLYETGVKDILPRDDERAIQYYQRVLELAPKDGLHIVPVYMAVSRVHMKKWLREYKVDIFDSDTSQESAETLAFSTYTETAASLGNSFWTRLLRWSLEPNAERATGDEKTSSYGSGFGKDGISSLLRVDRPSNGHKSYNREIVYLLHITCIGTTISYSNVQKALLLRLN